MSDVMVPTVRDLLWPADAWAAAEDLQRAGAPDWVLEDFAAHADDGLWGGCLRELLCGPLTDWADWALERGAIPPICVESGDWDAAYASHRGTARAGRDGVAVAGGCGSALAHDDGIARAGWRGRAEVRGDGYAIAGNHGRAEAWSGGTAITGNGGHSAVGNYGVAWTHLDGTVQAGAEGALIVAWWDRASRRRLAVAYVGEHADGLPPGDVVQADTPYRVEVVDGRPLWRVAEQGGGAA